MLDLEIWLIGTPSEVDTLMNAVTQAGCRLIEGSRPEPLYGTDTGRTRRYLRIRVPTTTAPKPTPGHTIQPDDLFHTSTRQRAA